MKKILIVLSLAVLLLVTVTACGSKEPTMQDIVEANRVSVLLDEYSSISEHRTDSSITRYYAKNYYVLDTESAKLLTLDNVTYAIIGEQRGRYLSELDEKDNLSLYADPLFDSELALGEEIESVELVTAETLDKQWLVKTSLPAESLALAGETGLVSRTVEYALAEKTLELLTLKVKSVYEDGKEKEIVTVYAYGVDLPAAAATLYNYAAQNEDLRKVTLVLDPDTEAEETVSYEVPKGLSLMLDANKYMAYSDRECTQSIAGSDDYVSDFTAYVKRK